MHTTVPADSFGTMIEPGENRKGPLMLLKLLN